VLERLDIRRLVEEKDSTLFSSRRGLTFKWCSVSLPSPVAVVSAMFAIQRQAHKVNSRGNFHNTINITIGGRTPRVATLCTCTELAQVKLLGL
jgi:hypothetical protein